MTERRTMHTGARIPLDILITPLLLPPHFDSRVVAIRELQSHYDILLLGNQCLSIIDSVSQKAPTRNGKREESAANLQRALSSGRSAKYYRSLDQQ